MPRPTIVTTSLVKRMKELRELGVPVDRIARDVGVNKETVRRHTSEKDAETIKRWQRERQERDKQNPEVMERRRETARQYAARMRERDKLKEPIK
jgi:AcrR family transcriptional regulator